MLAIYLLLAVLAIVVATARFRLHPFLALLLVAMAYGFCAGMPAGAIVASLNEGFGRTLGSIGLIIVLGVIIGTFLEKTGGAHVIAEKILGLLGHKNVATAMGMMGYVVSIPVFADSGFLLLSALNRSLCKSAGLSLAGAAIALSLGLTVSHTMIPPTPGPLAAAGLLGADLGLVLLASIPVSLVALAVSILFARAYVARRVHLEPYPVGTEPEPVAPDAAPGAIMSLLPILAPILLIVTKSIVNITGISENLPARFFNFMGEPFVALLIGASLALLLPRKLSLDMLSTRGWIGQALVSSATILLITGAGGAFGKVLQDSGIAASLEKPLQDSTLGIWLPFLLAAAIKTAQGSSTVALITAASILAPLMAGLGFDSDFARAMVVVAIGAGSAVVSHANDSFFWVVTQLSGMDTRTGYMTHTLGTLVMGLSAAVTVAVIYSAFS